MLPLLERREPGPALCLCHDRIEQFGCALCLVADDVPDTALHSLAVLAVGAHHRTQHARVQHAPCQDVRGAGEQSLELAVHEPVAAEQQGPGYILGPGEHMPDSHPSAQRQPAHRIPFEAEGVDDLADIGDQAFL